MEISIVENLPGTSRSETELLKTLGAFHRPICDSHMPTCSAAAVGMFKATGGFLVNVPPERCTQDDIIAVLGPTSGDARVLTDLVDRAIQRVGWLLRLADGLVRNRLITPANELGVSQETAFPRPAVNGACQLRVCYQ